MASSISTILGDPAFHSTWTELERCCIRAMTAECLRGELAFQLPFLHDVDDTILHSDQYGHGRRPEILMNPDASSPFPMRLGSVLQPLATTSVCLFHYYSSFSSQCVQWACVRKGRRPLQFICSMHAICLATVQASSSKSGSTDHISVPVRMCQFLRDQRGDSPRAVLPRVYKARNARSPPPLDPAAL